MQALERTLLATTLLSLLALATLSTVVATAALGTLLLVAITNLLPRVRGLRATRHLDAIRLLEGGTTHTRVEAHGRVLLPSVTLVRDRLPRIAEPLTVETGVHVGVGPFHQRATAELLLPVRGAAAVGPAQVVVMDPLGLASARFETGGADTIVVHPRAEDVREQTMRARYQRILAGGHAVRNPGASLEFYGLREYQPTDPMRAVNWKATARSADTLMVNQYEHESHAEVTLFLDARAISAAGTYRDNASHEIARTAATWAKLVARHRDLFRAYAWGPQGLTRFRPDVGRSWVDQFMDWAAVLESEGARPLQDVFDEVVPHLAPRSILVFLTPLYGADTLGDAPIRARALRNAVLVVVPQVPAAVPEPLATRLRQERADNLAKLTEMGIETLDLGHAPTLAAAVRQRRVVR